MKQKIENHRSLENKAEIAIMRDRINTILRNSEILPSIEADFQYTFEHIGLSAPAAQQLCATVLQHLASGNNVTTNEVNILEIFKATVIADGRTILKVLDEQLSGRAERIAQQVAPYLKGVNGKVIDYGTGDGQVAQLLHDNHSLDITGVDPRFYPARGVTVPIIQFDGKSIPNITEGTFAAALLTNTFHHESQNEAIFDELDRILAKTGSRIVVIETVPVGLTEEAMLADKDRTFMNDYLYNRLFHGADVPVPGTFETPQQWKERFAKHGWKLHYEEDLGFDQPTIKDRHYLFVFER